MKRSLALFFLICALLARPTFAQSQDEDEPEANPGRPKGAWPMFSSARRAFCIRAKVPSPRLRSATFIASTMAELRNSISEARPTRFWFWQARWSGFRNRSEEHTSELQSHLNLV